MCNWGTSRHTQRLPALSITSLTKQSTLSWLYHLSEMKSWDLWRHIKHLVSLSGDLISLLLRDVTALEDWTCRSTGTNRTLLWAVTSLHVFSLPSIHPLKHIYSLLPVEESVSVNKQRKYLCRGAVQNVVPCSSYSSIPRRSIWDLWWAKWYCGRVFSQYFVFPLWASFCQCSALVFLSATNETLPCVVYTKTVSRTELLAIQILSCMFRLVTKPSSGCMWNHT